MHVTCSGKVKIKILSKNQSGRQKSGAANAVPAVPVAPALYCAEDFAKDLQGNLDLIQQGTYQPFDNVFMNTLQTKHPLKEKTVRANHNMCLRKCVKE